MRSLTKSSVNAVLRELEQLPTEQDNPRSTDLDRQSALAIARTINAEDRTVAAAVELALPEIARAIDWVAEALSRGGRLIYVGAGTSGRIAALDALECPPTFDVPPNMVQFIMAGGPTALVKAIEADEDSRALGVREIRKKKPKPNDVVVGIAASGRTPFTVAAVEYAKRRGARTIAVSCNRNKPLERAAELAIVVETGPEVVSGSTRMKAGTAQKMVLNMISTAAMVRMGYVYGNLMVNLDQKNSKLTARALTIVQRALKTSTLEARRALRAANRSVPVAIVMAKAGVSRPEAESALKISHGYVRKAIAVAPKMH
jgi:N-acetylmuramic acid 6-phosphate etherase